MWQQVAEIYVGPIVAATNIGHVFDVRRYPTRHHFATANGTARIPASSGRTEAVCPSQRLARRSLDADDVG
jgi:Transposase IS116/IS110/IS902 family